MCAGGRHLPDGETTGAGARLWPSSLKGQVLLALALALLLAQTFAAILQYQVQLERRRDAQAHMLAFRFLDARRSGARADSGANADTTFRVLRARAEPSFAVQSGDRRLGSTETELRRILAELGMEVAEVVMVERPLADDGIARDAFSGSRALISGDISPREQRIVVAAVRDRPGATWLAARTFSPPAAPWQLAVLVAQTLIIYAVLVGAMALVVRRITQPLAALTSRLERFASAPTATSERSSENQLEPQGPDDLRRLISAHNAMESRIAGLLDENDVMLGAIGHDLKTPLAALRVRIESVTDDAERARMASIIEDVAHSLDDMLSLARVGRPTDPLEATELSALVGGVVDEFEDMGEPVVLAETMRVVLSLRATWLRRGLRNLIANAVRYGGNARISVAREGAMAVIRVDDDGPGIPESELARMFRPFTRGEPSRNSGTGGAGLGLTLARAVAEQHGGTLLLSNRLGHDGAIVGLTAMLSLPLNLG